MTLRFKKAGIVRLSHSVIQSALKLKINMIKSVESNVSIAECIALSGPKKRQDIVIKPFDKGPRVYGLNKKDYIHVTEVKECATIGPTLYEVIFLVLNTYLILGPNWGLNYQFCRYW